MHIVVVWFFLVTFRANDDWFQKTHDIGVLEGFSHYVFWNGFLAPVAVHGYIPPPFLLIILMAW